MEKRTPRNVRWQTLSMLGVVNSPLLHWPEAAGEAPSEGIPAGRKGKTYGSTGNEREKK
jgi:hypothetical protein